MLKKLIEFFKPNKIADVLEVPDVVDVRRIIVKITFDDNRFIEKEFIGKYSSRFNHVWSAWEYAHDFIREEKPIQCTDNEIPARIPRHRVKDYKITTNEEYWVSKDEN